METPSSSPVPRLMARSMLSFGMLLALASATAARRRALELTSPPPMRAATVISLMMRVKTFPRFASAAPFLCLIVLHLLWPDMARLLWRAARISRRADAGLPSRFLSFAASPLPLVPASPFLPFSPSPALLVLPAAFHHEMNGGSDKAQGVAKRILEVSLVGEMKRLLAVGKQGDGGRT